jgi:PleD family two-component response regulator
VRDRQPAGVEVTMSIGVAVSRPGSLNTDELIGLADAALYSAKAGGRDCVMVSSN